MDRITLKQKAKNSLQGKYGEAILVVLISGLITGVGSGIYEFGSHFENLFLILFGELLSFIANGLITFGSLSFYLKIARGEEVEFNELFKKTNLFIPYVLVSLLTGIFTVLWGFLFIIPGIIAAISYSQTMLITLENPEIDTMVAIKKSKELMQGHKMDYFVLNLSFIGWGILGLFTCGILYFWLIPYITVTQMHFYDALLEEKKNK